MVGSNDRGSPKGSSKGALSTPSSSALGSNGTSAKGLSTETPKLADSAGASSRVEQRLSVLAAKLAQLKDGAAAPELDAAMRELQDEVAHLKSVEEEITGYAERALAETERLTKENEELRKAQEDAALDRQMVKAMVEAEKLKAAGEAYKHDMMRAKVTELEADLQSTRHAAKREASSMSRALSEARNAISAREKEAQALKLELEKLKAAKSNPENGTAAQSNGSSNGPAESAELAEPSGTPLVSEHEEIAVRLMAAGPSGVDQALLAAAAKALRDVSVLDKQLLRAREEKLKLAREVEDLNNTVFSKSFKAPSAWAEREVKYKMEKRDWDAESKKLREAITKLEAENARYRADNKAEEFETQIQLLSKALSEKEAEKVEVQKELHELQIKSRDINPLGLNLRDIDHDVVHNIIEDMEKNSIGVTAPRTATPSQSSRGSPSRSGKGSPPRASVPPLDLASHFVPGSNVEEIIQDYDDKGMGMAGPRSGRSSRRKGVSRLSDGAAPDARAADSFEELHRSNVHDLQSNFLGASQHPSGVHPGSQAVHHSGSKGSGAEQHVLDAAGPSSGEPESEHGQPGITGQGREAESQSQGVAHVRDGFQGGPPVHPDAHGGRQRAAMEKKPLTTPREGLHAAFGSPLHPDFNSLNALEEEARGSSGAAVKEVREASRIQRQHAEPLHSHTSAPSAVAQQPDAGLQQEQHSRSTDQVLSSGAGLDNGRSATNPERQRGAYSRDMVENAFAVDHQDGEGAWPSGSREALADDCVSEASSTLAGLIRRGSSGTGGTRDSSSDGGDEWDVERRAALKADRAAAEAAWGAHVAENDIGVLRWKAAEAGSRVELYEAQISKMQLALERADQENSRLEQELRAITESSAKGREERQLTGLAGLRDRMRSISLLTGGSALEQQASERLQDAGEKLKSVQHERAALQKQRDALARQLAHVAEKISSGIIPDASELAVPEHIAAAAEASASATEVSGGDKSKSLGRPRFSGIGHVYAGLSDEEVEVMRLREENETLMETLVRTKVELAETQGDYLKTRRALLRSVEKQAHMSERLDSVKSAVSEGELEIAASLLLTSSPANRTRSAGGNTESLGERETPSVGVKRTRQRLGLEAYEEESSSSEVNVACGAVVPHSEHGGVGSRRVNKPAGSSLPGFTQHFDQDMASSPAGTEGALSFEVASLRAAASAAVAECTKLVDGGSAEQGQARKNRSAARPSAKSVADRVRPGARKLGARSPDDQDSVSSRANSRDSDIGSVSSSGTGQQLPSRGARDPAKLKSEASSGSLPHSLPAHGCPPHGAKAICGRRPRMEDAYTAIPFLMEVLVPSDVLGQSDILPPRIASLVKSATTSPTSSAGDAAAADLDAGGPANRGMSGPDAFLAQDSPKASSYVETLHFFGVFDGHGGAEGALHCAQTLHQRFVEAILEHTTAGVTPSVAAAEQMETSVNSTAASSSAGASGDRNQHAAACGVANGVDIVPTDPRAAQKVAGATDADTDSNSSDSDAFMVAAIEEENEAAAAGQLDDNMIACSAQHFESALTDAFNRTDEEFGKADNAALVGTTAVVALVGSRQLYVANCGDSRAVLCRGGAAIALTDDHKAAREDETARVEAAGGQILFWNGVRVMGVLAVSRAIGDHCLRPFVIAQPEVTILGRRPDDEILLLASDGLWDVLSNQEACTLAKRCLRRARQRGASRQSAARIAATVLTRAAVDRGSRDNVTVVVVDLSLASSEADTLARAPSAAAADDAGDDGLAPDLLARSRSSAAGALSETHSYPEPTRRL